MQNNQVSHKEPRFSRYDKEYKLIDDVWSLLAKQDDLREYLPERFNESPESYELRLQTTTLPGVFRDSIERGGGRLGKAQLSEDALEPIQALATNVDARGKTLDFFVFEVFTEVLKKQCCVVLVDTGSEEDGATLQMIPVTAVRNVKVDPETGKVMRLTITEEFMSDDGYGTKKEKRYKEYLPDRLNVWADNQAVDSKLGEQLIDDPKPLTTADNQARGEVYAVWFGTIGSKPWEPAAPPAIGLAKMSLHHMHKVSNLDRAEDMTALPPILRKLPEMADQTQQQPDVVWDPGSVEDVPFGGDIGPANTPAKDFAVMHQRNMDRKQEMNEFIDAYLHERVRTDFQAAQADDAETSRLEMMVKALQHGFKQCFQFAMLLSDRRYTLDQSPGELLLSATTYDQVTDEEIKLLADTFNVGVLPLQVAQAISIQQWKAKGYDIPEGLQTAPVPPNFITE